MGRCGLFTIYRIFCGSDSVKVSRYRSIFASTFKKEEVYFPLKIANVFQISVVSGIQAELL
jgi:hypothetical protein